MSAGGDLTAQSRQPAQQLPDEIWIMVLTFLKNPIPAPQSNLPRSALQQPDLCSAARVSKAFKSLCDSLLYTHVVTADFPSFVAYLEHSSAKRQLLSRTRSLRIGYVPKGEDPTYKELLLGVGQGWERYGLCTAAEVEAAKQEDCLVEVTRLVHCWQYMAQKTVDCIFPKLKSLSVASIYHRDPEIWQRHRDATMGQHSDSALAYCTSLFDITVSASKLEQLCVSDACGPLSVNTMSLHRTPLNFPRVIHFDAGELFLPFALGKPTRWIANPSPKPSIPWAVGVHNIGTVFAAFVKMKEHMPAGQAADIEIFYSSDHFGVLPPDSDYLPEVGFACGTLGHPIMRYDIPGPTLTLPKQRSMAAEMGNRAQQYLRLRHARADRVRWYSSDAAPICEACASGHAR